MKDCGTLPPSETTRPTKLRDGLPTLPAGMKDRPIDHRGYPVPWFVTLRDEKGNHEFRVLDPARYVEALRRKVCWICGGKLPKRIAFAVGPMCGVNRVSAEPPQHIECAIFAAKACPFMLLPKARRREHGIPEKASMHEMGLARNPGVMLIWVTEKFQVIPDAHSPLIRMGNPLGVTFWAEGRTATRAEIDESMRTGCPTLRNMAEREGALAEYERMLDRFTRMLPAA